MDKFYDSPYMDEQIEKKIEPLKDEQMYSAKELKDKINEIIERLNNPEYCTCFRCQPTK